MKKATRRCVRRTRLALVAGLTGVALLLAGCSGASDGSSEKSLSDEEIGEFVFAIAGAATSFDITKDYGNFGPIALVNEQLEHSKSDGTYVPGVADKVTETPTELTYHVRDDVTFSDGSPLTADDVVFSIERARAEGAQTASVFTAVDSVSAEGDTVTVTLSAPDPALRALLAGAVAVVSEDFVTENGDEFGSASVKTVGTGPYVLDSFDATKANFTRNEDYWGDKPKIEKLEIQFLNSDDTTQLAMRSGDVNGTLLVTTSGIRSYESIPGISLLPDSGNSVQYLSFDTSADVLDDVHVRRAIAYSLDRDGLIKALFSGYADKLQGMATANQLATVASPEEAEEFLSSLPQYDFDMDKAAEELAASDHADGFELTINTSDAFPWSDTVALNLQQNLKELGVTVNVRPVESQKYVGEIYAHEDLGVRAMGLAALTPDAAYILKQLLGSATAVENALNTANFASPEVDKDVETLATSSDDAARFEAAKGLLRAVAEDVPYIPLFNQQTIWVLGEGFGYDEENADGNDYATGLWIYNVRAAS